MEAPFPPFEPDEDTRKRRTRLRDIPLKTLFPNILTLLAICSGLTSIRFAIEDRIEMALGAIILAAFLDGIDGRVARFLKSTTRFGAQMDSLADFVNFGVAPAMLLYFTMLDNVRPFGWVAALLYAICACLRLARFNVQLDMPKGPNWQTDFFVGVPAPAGAMIVLLPVYLSLLGLPDSQALDWLVSVYVIFCGLLMVSSLPTYSGKSLGRRIPRNVALPTILATVVVIALLLSYPWSVLAAAAIAYLASLPWGYRYYHKLEERHAAGRAETAASLIEREEAETVPAGKTANAGAANPAPKKASRKMRPRKTGTG